MAFILYKLEGQLDGEVGSYLSCLEVSGQANAQNCLCYLCCVGFLGNYRRPTQVAGLQKWPDWSRLVIRHGCSMNGTLTKTGTHSEGASVQ